MNKNYNQAFVKKENVLTDVKIFNIIRKSIFEL